VLKNKEADKTVAFTYQLDCFILSASVYLISIYLSVRLLHSLCICILDKLTVSSSASLVVGLHRLKLHIISHCNSFALKLSLKELLR